MNTLKESFDHINIKIFDDIYNYTNSILKTNVHLTKLNSGKYVKSCYISKYITIDLPDTSNFYYLYVCDTIAINDLLCDLKGWNTAENILNNKQINIDIVTEDLRMIPKKLVHIYQTDSQMTLFAINRTAVTKFQSSTDMYIIINYDTNTVGDKNVYSHIPKYNENLDQVVTKFNAADKTKCLCFINGHYIESDKFLTFGNTLNDFYELYIDTNIAFRYELDLKDRLTYQSTSESLIKDLVILDKELLTKSITFDTISIIITNPNGEGVFLPFIGSKSISQLTHGAFGITSAIIDAALDKLQMTNNGKFIIVYSDYSKNNTLCTNGDLTEILYKLDNSKIKQIMSTNVVPYWSANTLEQSEYCKYMIHMNGKEDFSLSLIPKQIKCLGFYEFTKLLSPMNGTIITQSNTFSNLTVDKPLFWKDTNLDLIIYLNGKKIDSETFRITQTGTTISAIFDIPMYIDLPNSVIEYEFFKKAEYNVKRFVPTNSTHTVNITKSTGNLNIFKRTSNTILDVNSQEQILYNEIDINDITYFTIVEQDTSYIFIFKENSYSSEFIFQWDTTTFTDHYETVNLSDYNTISFRPFELNSDMSSFDVLNEQNFDIYINNDRFLIPNLDYKATLLTTEDNNTAGYCITILNKDYLKTSNSFDIVGTGRKIISSDIGYVINSTITKNIHNEAYIEDITRLFINGRLVPKSAITESVTHYVIDPFYCKNGNVYYFENSIPKDFYNRYKDYIDDNYFIGRQQVTTYLTKDYVLNIPNPLLLESSHQLYSAYLTSVIDKILNNEITVIYINNNEDILKQIQSLDYLKKFDILFSENKIDKKYIDIHPNFKSLMTTDFNKYNFINRLVKIILGQDPNTDYSIVYNPI